MKTIEPFPVRTEAAGLEPEASMDGLIGWIKLGIAAWFVVGGGLLYLDFRIQKWRRAKRNKKEKEEREPGPGA